MAHSVYQFLVSTCLTAAQSRSRNTVMPPVAAASVVFMATCAAKAPSLPDFMVNVEPGLKPYQPNLKENTGGILTTKIRETWQQKQEFAAIPRKKNIQRWGKSTRSGMV